MLLTAFVFVSANNISDPPQTEFRVIGIIRIFYICNVFIIANAITFFTRAAHSKVHENLVRRAQTQEYVKTTKTKSGTDKRDIVKSFAQYHTPTLCMYNTYCPQSVFGPASFDIAATTTYHARSEAHAHDTTVHVHRKKPRPHNRWTCN